MRLVHLAHYPAPYGGSFVPMLRAALSAARKLGWSTEAVFADDAAARPWLDELREDEVAVRLVPLGPRRDRQRAIAALLDEDGPTILHTHFTAFDVPAALAAAGRPEVRVVWHLHSPARRDLAGRIRSRSKLLTAGRRVDRILCVAPDLAETMQRQGAPAGRVVFFPNAIDTGAFRPAEPGERAAARSALGVEEARAVLLHFGWDWERKGGDLFLAAVEQLVDEGRPVSAVTVGGGERALERGRELAMGEALSVLPLGRRVQELYAASDVFVSPSRAEGMPFAMLEALASGVPVVASDIAGQAVQGRGLGACRLTALEPAAIATGIRSLLDRDPVEAERDAAAARERIRAELDLSPWAARLLALYDDLVRAEPTSDT
jgi:glycosyltransferase involved in cell wall biosynthesis